MGLIWKLFSLSGSLWVAWTQAELLRGESFWEVKETNKGSWLWRKLLKLRPLVSGFIRSAIGNGEATYFWLDDWLGSGRQIEETGDMGPRYLGIPRHTLVTDACRSGDWVMRIRGRRIYEEVYEKIEKAQKPDGNGGKDVMLWKHDEGDFKDTFSTRRTLEQIRIKAQEVDWRSIVWFPQGVPRQAFIVWLAIKDRLSTGVRMRQWGITQGCMLLEKGKKAETMSSSHVLPP